MKSEMTSFAKALLWFVFILLVLFSVNLLFQIYWWYEPAQPALRTFYT